MIAQEHYESDARGPAPTSTAPPAPEPAATPPRRKRAGRALAAGVIALALVGGAGSGAVSATLLERNSSTAAATTTGTTSPVSAPAASRSNASAVYQAVSPSVVTVNTVISGRFGQQGQGTGSGIVLDSKGDILTNYHVVSGAQQISVTLSDGTTAKATVVGTSVGNDLAVIRIAVNASQLHPVTLGDSGTVQVGNTVYAIGSPYGLSGTLTEGVVSGLNRSGSSVTGSGSTGSNLNSLIQTDAAINPGNSGGPLVNASGEVIGINQSIESPVDGNTGVGFAIPINLVKQLLPQLEGGSNL